MLLISFAHCREVTFLTKLIADMLVDDFEEQLENLAGLLENRDYPVDIRFALGDY